MTNGPEAAPNQPGAVNTVEPAPQHPLDAAPQPPQTAAPPVRQPVTVMLPGMNGPMLTDTVYISFSAEINANTSESLLAVVANLVNLRVPHIYLMLSTPGGQVMNGLNLYNVLRGLQCDLTVHNVGNVDSIGNAIFLAGTKRYACPHSTFMFHGVGLNTPAGMRLEEKSMKEVLQNILADQRRIGQILEERTNLTNEQVNGLFLEAQTKDATFAIGCGIVHEIRDVQIPAGGPVISLVFQRQGV
jgi:ATP-dependent Clp protease, protease subunit